MTTGDPGSFFDAAASAWLVLDALFGELVTDDEAAFARELYLSRDDAGRMVELGMTIAGHGSTHARLGLIDDDQLEVELAETVALLASVYGELPSTWTMVYPHGSCSPRVVRRLEQLQCGLGFLSAPGVATESTPRFEIPRVNTNDLPAG